MIFAYYLLNIIQAVAEFLPISSSGHLIIVGWLYGISEHGLEAFLHLPTTLAIFLVFYSTFFKILKDKKTWPILLMAMLPAGIIGFLFGDALDAIFYSPIVVGINQIFWSGVLWYAAVYYPRRKVQEKTAWQQLSLRQALGIGFAQVLALIPGTSRSGITTLAGIWQGLNPSQSAVFSFVSGFPLIAAASAVGFLKLAKEGELLTTLPATTLLLGMALSVALSILFAKLFTSRHTLTVMKVSGIYRLIVGFLILVWLT